jgi:hypothetical protein
MRPQPTTRGGFVTLFSILKSLSFCVWAKSKHAPHIIFLHNGLGMKGWHGQKASAFFNIKSWPIQRKEYIFHCGLGI